MLFLEDDTELAPEVVSGLRRAGFVLDHVGTCTDANLQIKVSHDDALVLDRGVPDGDALDWLAGLRAAGKRFPALMTTARADVAGGVDGFEHGADDYLVKSFAFPELEVRVPKSHWDGQRRDRRRDVSGSVDGEDLREPTAGEVRGPGPYPGRVFAWNQGIVRPGGRN